MKPLVVDASVAVKWQLDDEEHVDKADAIKGAFLRNAIDLIVPVIFAVEWANAINVAITRGRFPEEEWQEALEDLEALQISVRNPPGLLFDAWQIARLYRRTVYDGLYIALAKVEKCEMVTGDKKLFNAVNPGMVHFPVELTLHFLKGPENPKANFSPIFRGISRPIFPIG